MAAANEKATRPVPGDAGARAACRSCGCADLADAPAEPVPDWRQGMDPAGVANVDVRPMLAVGEPPLAAVIEAAERVAAGGTLLVEAPFDPQPLRRVLAGKGFSTYGERVGAGHWRIWCRRDEAGGVGRQADGSSRSDRTWKSGDVVHIDVRGLEAPKPLVAILALIDGGAHAGCIVVHHHREPLYLYPELEERGWRYSRLPAPPDEVRLELRGPS